MCDAFMVVGRRIGVAVLVAALLAGCGAPGMAPEDPLRWPRNEDLAAKAELIEAATLARVTDQGMLVYRWREPFTDIVNFRRSHYLADAAAWQGYLIAALAFKAATLDREGALDAATKEDLNGWLTRLVGFFSHCYEITGQQGLICRSALPGYHDPEPLPFMLRPGTGYEWQYSSSATPPVWYLNRPNKDHVNMAAAGLGIALALGESADILTPAARSALLGVAEPLAARLVRDDYYVLDRAGERTRHPDLTAWSGPLPDGFNRIMALQILATAARFGDDADLRAEYERRLEQWGTGYAGAMHAVGAWTQLVGHARRRFTPGHWQATTR